MSFDWDDFMKLAGLLAPGAATTIFVDSSHGEACQRTAVSRAYYAAFHKTCEFLRQHPGYKNKIPQGPNAHTKVPELMRTSQKREWQKVGNKLRILREDRNKVDYDADISQLTSLTAKAMTSASKILDMLKSF